MLWLQGESDAKANKGDEYKKNLTGFIADMREKFKTPEMPFVIARVKDHIQGRPGEANKVRDAQVKVAESDKNCEWFDTDDCSLFNPGHYDGPGLIVIGNRFAEKLLKVIK